MTGVGIEVIGGGGHKFTRTSVNVEGEGNKGFILKDTINNEFEDVEVFVGNSLEKLKRLQFVISDVKDDSLNPKTKNTFREDILNKLPDLSNLNEANISQNTLKEIRSTLSDWITIKAELHALLYPFVFLMNTMLGGG